MTKAPVTLVQDQQPPVRPAPSKDKWPVLQGRWISSKTEAEAVKEMVAEYSTPASPVWICTRVMQLLGHFYAGELPSIVHEGVSSDWLQELCDLPDWAIDAACRWWVGRDNKKRGKRPLPGDISERAEEIMAGLRIAKTQIERYEKHGDNPPEYLK